MTFGVAENYGQFLGPLEFWDSDDYAIREQKQKRYLVKDECTLERSYQLLTSKTNPSPYENFKVLQREKINIQVS